MRYQNILKIDTILMLDLKRKAEQGVYEGRNISPYFSSCAATDTQSGTRLIYTRDTGMHSSGWFKNPDYERCYHLSLSFFDPISHHDLPRNDQLTRDWLNAFFGHNVKLLWCEPPLTPQGKARDTWHYRLFCDPGWRPIKPRGEVYSKEFTEKGWRSFSDVLYEENKRREAAGNLR